MVGELYLSKAVVFERGQPSMTHLMERKLLFISSFFLSQ